jgi:hypothetical protein
MGRRSRPRGRAGEQSIGRSESPPRCRPRGADAGCPPAAAARCAPASASGAGVVAEQPSLKVRRPNAPGATRSAPAANPSSAQRTTLDRTADRALATAQPRRRLRDREVRVVAGAERKRQLSHRNSRDPCRASGDEPTPQMQAPTDPSGPVWTPFRSPNELRLNRAVSWNYSVCRERPESRRGDSNPGPLHYERR